MTATAHPPLIDTHAHLQDSLYDDDRADVLTRAREAGVAVMVVVGYDLPSSRRAVELAASHHWLQAAVGIHPNYACSASEANWQALRELARRPEVVSLGETGLDNYRKYTPPVVQEIWLERHLDLASELNLPVIIHNRQADARLRTILRDWTGSRKGDRPAGVMHCFSADETMLADCLSMGFVISFAGPLTFKNAQGLRDLARRVPADRLVVETDSPYLTPHPYRGERNEPAHLQYTARCLAELRNEPFEALAARTTETATALFGLSVRTGSGAAAP